MYKPKKHEGYMSGVERQRRRKLFAQLVSTGQKPREVAERFGVSDVTVRTSCKEYGVDIRFRRRGPSMGVYVDLRSKKPAPVAPG